MATKQIEFTSLEATTLIPIVNSIITLHESVFERNLEHLDIKKIAFLKLVVNMLNDSKDLDLVVIIEVNEYYYHELQLLKDILIDVSVLFNPEAKQPYISSAVKIDKVLQHYSHCKAVNV